LPGLGGASDASTVTGTNDNGCVAPTRARRRQSKTCCGVSPCRRAISDTTAPGTSVSSTIRAFSSPDQVRRRTSPVITSIRRTARGGSTVRSGLRTSRSHIRDHQPERERARTEGGSEASLTIMWSSRSLQPSSSRLHNHRRLGTRSVGIGRRQGRPLLFGLGRCGAINRHSASVRSLW